MKRILTLFCSVTLLGGCSDSTDDSDINSNGHGDPLTGVQLIFPSENALCNEGVNLTQTESTVYFEWEPNTNAEIYKLTLENLSSGNIELYETSNYIIPIAIQRAEAFRWSVAYDYQNETRVSAQWNFYNAGPGLQTYPPFPADIIAPSMAQIINATNSVTLQWLGNDVDNDIIAYDVYFANTNPPSLDSNDITANQLTVSVNPGTIYYWNVLTKDAAGNTSESGVYQFRISE
ncbi:hypothetical protein [Paucihalobacter sp.]|uniref:hypothetical protein n=1 Tax=Paucihalobacter sp. TaxID=2850405 RepID=UPI002FE0040B